MKNSNLPKLLATKANYIDTHYQFEDIDNSYSEKYWAATDYCKGFARVVRTLKGDFEYRDLLGRVTAKPTRTGKEFYKFYIEEIPLRDIHMICFADKVFCEGLKSEIIRRHQAKIKEMFQKGEKISKAQVEKEIKKDFDFINRKHEKAFKIMKKKGDKTIKKFHEDKKKLLEQKPDYSKEYFETKEYLNSLTIES